ncbi:MAG: Na+/H+ antiporter NhaA [Chitinophagaceae bacterium]|nr:Na+/H+ antiporter NhaA [Chitinophagaceae bacterium]
MILAEFVHRKLLHPLRQFMHDSRAIGITLLACTFLSLILANWPGVGDWYRNLWHYSLDGSVEHHAHLGFLSLPNSPLLVINDALMAVFFFLAGMEIKRELVCGELASIKKSILPVMGAIGGMLAPALLYALFNKGTAFINGWAVPTATDIAFTLGIASLLGKRVPVALKIFLTALAIIDDLGAIVVIALFYGGAIQAGYLLLCLATVVLLWFLNQRKVAFGIWHWLLGLVLWYAMFNSGIHATVAGVIFAFLVPVKQLESLELRFHTPVYFIIMPIFALSNTAIAFPENSLTALNSSLSWGILAGLCLGKPLGICAAAYLLVSRKLADLPSGTNWKQLMGGAMLAGIGFTMSIFISTLAFNQVADQDIAKISVLLASLLAMAGGYIWLKWVGK